jgi:hypothetical protein
MRKFLKGIGETIKKMKNKISILSVGLSLIFLVSCREDISPIQDHEVVPTPRTIISDNDFHVTLPSGLSINAYELEAPPSTEPLVFVPISDYSQEKILANHADERKLQFPDNSFFDEMKFGMKTKFNGRELIALEEHIISTDINSPASVVIEVMLNDEVIYSADTGNTSPVTSLQGLWSYDQDWVLEYADVTVTYSETENTASSIATGHIVKNGVSLNEQLSFAETFGFQLMSGKPFYFLEEEGQIGISYDEQVTMLGFEEIPHYGCCSAGMLNPNCTQNMVSFFAQKGSTWYYVEIGVYE